MWLLRWRFAVHPGDRRADRYLERIGMEGKVADRDEVMQRVDDGHGHAALRRAPDGWSGAAVREAGEGDCGADGAHYQHEPFHGCLTTTTAFMNGCGVQWKAYSPACANV